MKTVFLVRQLLFENEFNFTRIDCEAVFSTFEAAHDFMLQELCPKDLGEKDLEFFRNEILELPLDGPIQAGFLSRKVYLPTGELHVDYAAVNEKHEVVAEGSRVRLRKGDLVQLLPDYRYPGATFFNGECGVLLESSESAVCERDVGSESLGEKFCKVFYITNQGIGTVCFAAEEELEPLTKPLERELEFLMVLSDHLQGRKLLAHEVVERLTDMSKGLLFVRKIPVFDFSKGTILKKW